MRKINKRNAVGILAIAAAASLGPVGLGKADVGPSTPQEHGAVITLTQRQKNDAIDLAKRDNAFKATLRGIGFTVQEIGPWTNGGGSQLLGVAARLKLDRSLSGKFTWPGVNPDERNGKKFTDGIHHVEVVKVDLLDILIDSTTGRVVSVSAAPTDSQIVVPLDDALVSTPNPDED